jgi:hypothetical protein
MTTRCAHGVRADRACRPCFELGTRFWEEVRQREQRLDDIRAVLRALLPAPAVVQDMCCALYNARHANPPQVAPAVDRSLGAALLSLLIGRFDLENAAVSLAEEIERAERRGYVRGAADERARTVCHRTNQPRAPLGPGESRCDDEESEDDEQRRVSNAGGRGGARAAHAGEEGALEEAV